MDHVKVKYHADHVQYTSQASRVNHACHISGISVAYHAQVMCNEPYMSSSIDHSIVVQIKQ